MRILTVGYLHGAGGAERQIILLSNQLAERGMDVTLCILAEYNTSYKIGDNVNVVDLTHAEKGSFTLLKRFWAFREFVLSYNPDVIINYNLQSAYFCLAITPKKRGKIIYSERGDPYDDEYSGLLGKIRDFTVRKMDGLVFQSEGARDFFDDTVRKKSVVIHNAVNIPQNKYPIPSIREKRIINVGRLHHQKNQALLINAFSRIANKFPDFILEIYGDGELNDALQHQINELGLSKRIMICPPRKDLWDCIYKASLFVLSSDFEGMPNALMEAMALGLPCISTDCRPGGARTLIDSGVNGVIVPVRNVDELAFAMSKCITRPDFSEKIAKNARSVVNTHSEEVLFDKWEKFLIELQNN